MSRLMYPTLILNTISTGIFFPLGKMIGMVRSRIRFILSSRSWEIGSPPTGGAGTMKDEVILCCARITHTYQTYSYILRKDPLPQYEHCQCMLIVRYILVEYNYFSEKKGRMYLVKEM